MDEQNFDKLREEARANGYSDEEIDQYIREHSQPLTSADENKRHEQNVGMAETGAAKLAQYGLEGYGGYQVAKGLVNAAGNAFRGQPAPAPAPAPAPQTTFTGGANPAWDAALSQPHPQASPMNVAPQPPSAANFMGRMSQLASRYLPAAAAAGAIGQGLFYTSPEEIATMRAAEAQRRAQGWKPLNER